MGQAAAADLETLLRERGASLVGFADLSPLEKEVRAGFPSAVAFGVTLTPSIVAGIADGPTEAYAQEYVRVNRLLDEIAEAGAAFLRNEGWRAEARMASKHPLPADLVTPLPQKTVATLAGLGWIGKCALLVTPQFGPAIRLNSVLTDAPLPPAVPVVESACGDCRICVDICPGRAPAGHNWRRGMARADFFDAFACHAACDRVGKERGLSQLICGRCVARCRFTQRWLSESR